MAATRQHDALVAEQQLQVAPRDAAHLGARADAERRQRVGPPAVGGGRPEDRAHVGDHLVGIGAEHRIAEPVLAQHQRGSSRHRRGRRRGGRSRRRWWRARPWCWVRRGDEWLRGRRTRRRGGRCDRGDERRHRGGRLGAVTAAAGDDRRKCDEQCRHGDHDVFSCRESATAARPDGQRMSVSASWPPSTSRRCAADDVDDGDRAVVEAADDQPVVARRQPDRRVDRDEVAEHHGVGGARAQRRAHRVAKRRCSATRGRSRCPASHRGATRPGRPSRHLRATGSRPSAGRSRSAAPTCAASGAAVSRQRRSGLRLDGQRAHRADSRSATASACRGRRRRGPGRGRCPSRLRPARGGRGTAAVIRTASPLGRRPARPS